MDTVAEAISDITYAFQRFQSQLADLTEAEMTTKIVDQENGYTLRDILAHLVGWEDYVLEALPVMLTTVDNQRPPVDVTERNRQALINRRGHSIQEILTEFDEKHQRIIELLESASPEDLTLRRTQRGMIFTIKSYVVDVLKNHIVEHSEQLKIWREENLL